MNRMPPPASVYNEGLDCGCWNPNCNCWEKRIRKPYGKMLRKRELGEIYRQYPIRKKINGWLKRKKKLQASWKNPKKKIQAGWGSI